MPSVDGEGRGRGRGRGRGDRGRGRGRPFDRHSVTGKTYVFPLLISSFPLSSTTTLVTLTRNSIRPGGATREAPNLKLRRPELLTPKLRVLLPRPMTGLLHQQTAGVLRRRHQIPGLHPHPQQMTGGLHLLRVTVLQPPKTRRTTMIVSQGNESSRMRIRLSPSTSTSPR
jgi:hypothetical protein